MSLTDTIRLYSERGPGNFDDLVNICSPLIKHVNQGKFINGSMINFIEELYMELVKREMIKPLKDLPETEKRVIWAKAKESGEKDIKILSKHSRAIYVSQIMN
jgi:hypothetical protein